MVFGKGVNFVPDRDIPSLKGKVVLITGGNSGLGKESILQLSRHDPDEIWLSARSLNKAQRAIDDIRAQVPNAPPIKFLEMDLTSFASIRRAASSFNHQSSRLDILILNAGIMATPEGVTEDGYEVQFGTNHMGHALFSKLLLPTLLKTAEIPGSDVRVVVLSSSGHGFAPNEQGIVFDTLKTNAENLSTVTRYGQSKLANLLFAQEFARRYPQIVVAAVHPGVVNTNLANTMNDSSFLMRIGWKVTNAFVGVNASTGVTNQLWASTAKGVKSGEYYEPVGKTGMGKKWSNCPELSKKLWDWTEKEFEGQEKVL